jgi:hypothetical protein
MIARWLRNWFRRYYERTFRIDWEMDPLYREENE